MNYSNKSTFETKTSFNFFSFMKPLVNISFSGSVGAVILGFFITIVLNLFILGWLFQYSVNFWMNYFGYIKVVPFYVFCIVGYLFGRFVPFIAVLTFVLSYFI